MRGVVLLLAAGRGRRLGEGAKAFVKLCGVPLVRRAADAAASAGLVDSLVVAVPPGMEAAASDVLRGLARPWRVVAGGDTRQASAAVCLAAAGEPSAVAVHDVARALCPPSLFDACLRALDGAAGVVPVVPLTDTVKRTSGGRIAGTPDRTELVAAQTPQAFRTDVYRAAHAAAERDGFVGTDDAALVERLGAEVVTVPGDPSNMKITSPLDLAVASAHLAKL